jgi:hypothetical protein
MQRSMRKWGTIALLTLSSIAVIVAITTAEVPGDRPAVHAGLSAEIDQLAVNAAAAHGDSTPQSVTWLTSTRGSADALIGNDIVSSTVPVYVLEVSGDFRLRPDSSLSGVNLWYIISINPFRVTDFGLNNAPVALTSLGSPEVDSLQGISPISAAVFISRYHVAVRHRHAAASA